MDISLEFAKDKYPQNTQIGSNSFLFANKKHNNARKKVSPFKNHSM